MSTPCKQFPTMFVLAAALCTATGCGARMRVEGNVTLDGAPVDGGVISFFQGSGPGSDKGNSLILGGKYVIEGEKAQNLAPGSYTVQIHWLEKLNKSGSNLANPDTSAAVKQLIPPQYNVKSTLTKELSPGTNKIDFDLKSK